METNVLVVGGGLSGLALADALHQEGVDFQLAEAQDRFGGRILTANSEKGSYDLGPAWFWPGQPRILKLIERFNLTRFEQYTNGKLVFEDETGAVLTGKGFASTPVSWRLSGGLQRLLTSLSESLPHARVHLGHALTRLSKTPFGVEAAFSNSVTMAAQKVVLALPPRVIADSIIFTPALPEFARETMAAIPTWMAGQAKTVAIYNTAFWREEGLSGDAISRRGPLAEIHDASQFTEQNGALFGFIGVPPHARRDEGSLRKGVLAQLVRLFGAKAEKPEMLLIKDWSADKFAATSTDAEPVYSHPRYGLPNSMRGLMEGRILFAGTETAPQFGGYLEGALEAAERAAQDISSLHKMISTV